MRGKRQGEGVCGCKDVGGTGGNELFLCLAKWKIRKPLHLSKPTLEGPYIA